MQPEASHEQIVVLDYAYGDAELELNLPSKYEDFSSEKCNLRYKCQLLKSDGVSTPLEKYEDFMSEMDLCTNVDNTLTRISFNDKNGSYSFWTRDTDSYPPGRYLL